MYFEQNSKYNWDPLHLTRWVAPTPIYPQYHADTPINVSSNKINKGQIPICTFYFHPSYRDPDRHTDAPKCMTVAPDTTSFHHVSTLKPYLIESYTHS